MVGGTVARRRLFTILARGLGLMLVLILAAPPIGAGQAPQVVASGGRQLTPEEIRQIEAQMPELRARAIAAARRALANPEFVAAVQRMAAAQGSDDQNEVAVPLQLASGLLYFYGTSKIKEALLAPFGFNISALPPKFKRYSKAEQKDLNPAKTLAIGLAAVGASAAMAYLSPPVVVEDGFREKSFFERVNIVRSAGWQLPGPSLVETTVDDTSDPASCTASLDLEAVLGGPVADFGEFEERELAWTYPFGSYPNLGEVVPALVSLIRAALGDFPGIDVGELIVQVSGLGEFSVQGPVADFIDDLLASALYIEDLFYDNFSGWRFSTDRIMCNSGVCTAPDGRSHAIFEGTVSSIPGILGYDFRYREPIQVRELFKPVFTGLQEHLTVYYEALEPGGVPTSLPPVGFDGSPVPGHSQLLDPTWFGLEDNCDPAPALEWSLPAFLELGIHELPVRGTDRSGNVTEDSITVVVRDSLPPDILPPDDVGITAPFGASTVDFTAPGVGCVTWLCEGDPPQYVLHPPLSFDFGSLEPVIDCTVSNSLYAAPAPCDGARLAVGESNTVSWTLTDPSGNGATVTQQAIVRAAGTNRIPSVQGASYTIPNVPEGVTIQLPLTASDPDLDPLSFIVQDLPGHGDLGLTAEAIFQTRFASSGAIRRATSFVKMTGISGNPSDLLIVSDGPSHRLLIFDIVAPDNLYLYDMVDLGDIAPDAIQLPGKPRVVDGWQLNTVLRRLWIADFTDEGNGDPSVNVIYRDATAPKRMVDVSANLPAGSHGRDFHLEGIDFAGSDQSADLVVYATGEPPLLDDDPPAYPPENVELGYHLDSSDGGSTWTVTVTNPGSAASRTSTVWSDGEVGCTGPADAFWSTSPPWGEISGPHSLTPFLVDPDGTGPALPVLQDPTSFGQSSCGGSTPTVLVLESQNNWLEAFTYDATPNSPLTRVQDAQYPLRLTRFIDIRSIEEIPGAVTPRFFVLDDTGVYRFDLAGRLDAFLSFVAGKNNSAPPAQGSHWADLATDPAGHVFLLSSSDQSEGAVSSVLRYTVYPGVGNFHDNGTGAAFGNTGDKAWAIAADGSNIFVLGGFGFVRCGNDL
ncbi:MAG TPA: hypothetical protein ENK19_07895, partial [Acidobacteria bacterium]|nr:hypothetical protein [Acidobacteriota bacterium]